MYADVRVRAGCGSHVWRNDMVACHFAAGSATRRSLLAPRQRVWDRVGDVVGGGVWSVSGVRPPSSK